MIRSRVLAAVTVVASLLAGLTVAVLSAAVPAGADERSNYCGDVRFIGAAGSGEVADPSSEDPYEGFGREMWTLRSRLSAAMPSWVDFKSESVPYPALSIIPDLVVTPDLWFDGLKSGIQRLAGRLVTLRELCPNERILLGGYSQGALVIHNVLDGLHDSSDPFWAKQIWGVDLLADPRRAGDDRGVVQGKARTGAKFGGVTRFIPAQPEMRPARVPQEFRAATRSWCGQSDPVCDAYAAPSDAAARIPRDLALFFDRHTQYGLSVFPDIFYDESTRMTARIAALFPTAPTTSLDPVAVGYPMNHDLRDGFTGKATFALAHATALPDGVRLSPSGRLYGVPKTLGNVDFDISVKSAANDYVFTTVTLPVVDPFELVPLDDTDVPVPVLAFKQPVSLQLPGVSAAAVVTLDDTNVRPPAGLRYSSSGKITGRPTAVGRTTVTFRIADPGGGLRRTVFTFSVALPARLVSANAAGVPADAPVRNGIVLDADHVAFVSDATNLTHADDSSRETVYIKDLRDGSIASWRPPADESRPQLVASPDRTSLFVATYRFDPDTFERLVEIRSISAPSLQAGELAPAFVTEVHGLELDDRQLAADQSGLLLISDNPAGTISDDYTGLRGLYRPNGVGGFDAVPMTAPEDDGPWSLDAIDDVTADGSVLVSGHAPNSSQTALLRESSAHFSFVSGVWAAVDIRANGKRIVMRRPQFFYGGIAFGSDASLVPRANRVVARVIADVPDDTYFKSTTTTNPVRFGPSAQLGGVVPLTATTWAGGCRIFDSSKTSATGIAAKAVYQGAYFDSCPVGGHETTVTPISDATQLLVAGPTGEGPTQLLLAGNPYS